MDRQGGLLGWISLPIAMPSASAAFQSLRPSGADVCFPRHAWVGNLGDIPVLVIHRGGGGASAVAPGALAGCLHGSASKGLLPVVPWKHLEKQRGGKPGIWSPLPMRTGPVRDRETEFGRAWADRSLVGYSDTSGVNLKTQRPAG